VGSRHREAESQSGILNVITCFDDLDSASTLCSLAGCSHLGLAALRRLGGLVGGLGRRLELGDDGLKALNYGGTVVGVLALAQAVRDGVERHLHS